MSEMKVEAITPRFPEGTSGIVVAQFPSSDPLEQLIATVQKYFSGAASEYEGMPSTIYWNLVARAQDEMNEQGMPRKLANELREILISILQSTDLAVQTNLYLRATRPISSGIQEAIGWHRESFYGPNMQHAVNVWIPILNVTPENSLRYIPQSHLIPDENIEIVQKENPNVPRFSDGHKIGLLYAPKTIVRGVDFDRACPLIVPVGAAAIFASSLIHGAATNTTQDIRFSADFRVIAAHNLRDNKPHFASGTRYFEPL